MSSEIYLVQAREPEDPVAFYVANESPQDPIVVNLTASWLIKEVLDLTGVDDPQADIIADLFQKGVVYKDLLPDLWATLESDNPASTLIDAVTDLSAGHRCCDSCLFQIKAAVKSFPTRRFEILTTLGFRANLSLLTNQPEAVTFPIDDIEEEDRSLPTVEGMDDYIFGFSITWPEDGSDFPRLDPSNELVYAKSQPILLPEWPIENMIIQN